MRRRREGEDTAKNSPNGRYIRWCVNNNRYGKKSYVIERKKKTVTPPRLMLSKEM